MVIASKGAELSPPFLFRRFIRQSRDCPPFPLMPIFPPSPARQGPPPLSFPRLLSLILLFLSFPIINKGQNPAEPQKLIISKQKNLHSNRKVTIISYRKLDFLCIPTQQNYGKLLPQYKSQQIKGGEQQLKLMHKIALLLLLATTILAQNAVFNGNRTFCWRDSYGRGAGVPVSQCSSGREKIGLLCYTKCPTGYTRFGFDCHQNCPGNFEDQGLFCRMTEYGRGAGYPWSFWDGFSNSGMISRCEAANGGAGKCEMYGAIAYPKCKAGYYNAGCCICRPNSFKCSQYGMSNDGQLDLSCSKGIIIGDPIAMMCPANLEQNGYLCYPQCKLNYKGVGPVCWGQPPSKTWIECAMGAANSVASCALVTANQVYSVFNMAFSLATAGASGEATAVAKQTVMDPGLIGKLKEGFSKMKELYNKNQNIVDFFKKAGTVASTASTARDIVNLFLVPDPTPADIIRITAEMAALFDPYGIAGTVAAFSYPLCTDIKV